MARIYRNDPNPPLLGISPSTSEPPMYTIYSKTKDTGGRALLSIPKIRMFSDVSCIQNERGEHSYRRVVSWGTCFGIQRLFSFVPRTMTLTHSCIHPLMYIHGHVQVREWNFCLYRHWMYEQEAVFIAPISQFPHSSVRSQQQDSCRTTGAEPGGVTTPFVQH